ncbi:hypothetical protein CVS40_0629 [Lucilia cuprina]|nr:hypothetical protein CVS40_0629 [Lucilia cuprina]
MFLFLSTKADLDISVLDRMAAIRSMMLAKVGGAGVVVGCVIGDFDTCDNGVLGFGSNFGFVVLRPANFLVRNIAAAQSSGT